MKKQHFVYLSLLLMVFAFASCNSDNEYFDADKGPYYGFPELGDTTSTKYQYVTHTTTYRGKKIRNYTLCYDKSKYAAQWVAYPLHSCYIGGQSRSEAWALDPNIEDGYQHNTGTYGYGLTRGHQIPSADRTASADMNAQTFYMSNMTPQFYNFNGGIWLTLESRARDKYMCKDTLYVVTGAYWGSNPSKVNGTYPIPTNYYKLFLRSRSGNTGKTIYSLPSEDIICIGFWLDHDTSDEVVSSKHCKSVADIEKLTGFTFFTNVDVDKTQLNISDWGFSE